MDHPQRQELEPGLQSRTSCSDRLRRKPAWSWGPVAAGNHRGCPCLSAPFPLHWPQSAGAASLEGLGRPARSARTQGVSGKGWDVTSRQKVAYSSFPAPTNGSPASRSCALGAARGSCWKKPFFKAEGRGREFAKLLGALLPASATWEPAPSPGCPFFMADGTAVAPGPAAGNGMLELTWLAAQL